MRAALDLRMRGPGAAPKGGKSPRGVMCPKPTQVYQDLRRLNPSGEDPIVGIDAQTSSWSIRSPETMDLYYLDTSTPLLRIQGEGQIDPEVFLKAAPPLRRWLLKTMFLQEVLDRYYDPHSVLVDLAANYIKEKRRDLIPRLVQWINGELQTSLADLDVEPLSAEGVYKYYKGDARIWGIYLSSRKLHRFVATRILRRRYGICYREK